MSLQYRNISKSQLTSPTPAQLPAVAVSLGHIVYIYIYIYICRHFLLFVVDMATYFAQEC
jgi:hypothetical protein